VAGSPVRAGWPNAGQEAQPETLSLDTFLIGDLRNTVLLPVKGDSMIDVGIRDGDVVVVARRTDAHNGQIVVALVEGEPTLKRLAFERGQPVLRAENSAYATIRPKGGLEIFGVVVGLARRYR
jgi:repressor LexA